MGCFIYFFPIAVSSWAKEHMSARLPTSLYGLYGMVFRLSGGVKEC